MMKRYSLVIGALMLSFGKITLTQTFFPGNLNPCRKGLCQNGGTCIAPIDYPQCICAPGFYGTFCEFSRDPCFNFICFNGGRCTAPADFPYCECRPGYTGDRCQMRQIGGNGGQCPIVRPGSVGKCGGSLCSVDSDCSSGLKCCKNACGRKRCTNVKFNEPVDLVSLCSLIDCSPERYCRPILPCATCTPVATCVPLSTVGGIDQECLREKYLQALLIQSANQPDTYNTLKCGGRHAIRDCPRGSVCVGGVRGGGVCCFGKTLVVEKPGMCAAQQLGDQSLCIGTLCHTDDQCPNIQKCCSSACGNNFCTDVFTHQPYCPGGCPKGYICENSTVPCPEGLACIQIVTPTCVPQTDSCGGCPSGQVCEFIIPPCPPPPGCDTPDLSRCNRPFCVPVPRCVPAVITPVPVDPCGGCQPGQVCIDTGLRCVTTPCPSYQCVTNNSCGGCPPGQLCQQLFPSCLPPRDCDEILLSDPSATCIVSECKPINTCLLDIARIDECEGCPAGQTCQSTGVVCKKDPCPSFACFDSDD